MSAPADEHSACPAVAGILRRQAAIVRATTSTDAAKIGSVSIHTIGEEWGEARQQTD